MNCDSVKDLLLTDYADGEIDAIAKKKVEKHMENCPRCTEFNQSLQRTMEPFRNAKRVDVPGHLWEEIRSAVAKEETGRIGIGGFRERLAAFLKTHKPVLAAAMVSIVVIGALAVSRMNFYSNGGGFENLDSYLQEQARFPTANGNNMELGTTIEEYLL